MSELTMTPGRKSIDSTARTSSYWRRSPRSTTKYVRPSQNKKVRPGQANRTPQIKRTIAYEEEANAQFTAANAQFTHETTVYGPPSDRPWEAFTQGIGPLVSPDFGPGGMRLAFKEEEDATGDDGPVVGGGGGASSVRMGKSSRGRKGYGGGDVVVVSDVRGGGRGEFADRGVDARGGVPVLFGARVGRSRLRFEAL